MCPPHSHRPLLFPDTERATDGDELTDVIRGVIGHQQNGAQVRLVALPVGTFAVRSGASRASVFIFSRDRFNDAMLSLHAASLGGIGIFGQ